MAVRTREEILEQVRTRLGDDASDEAIALVEDISDTISDYETRANGDGTDWKSRYEENDKEWRKKYRDRFFNGGTDDNNDDVSEPEEKPLTFEDLFKEKE